MIPIVELYVKARDIAELLSSSRGQSLAACGCRTRKNNSFWVGTTESVLFGFGYYIVKQIG